MLSFSFSCHFFKLLVHVRMINAMKMAKMLKPIVAIAVVVIFRAGSPNNADAHQQFHGI